MPSKNRNYKQEAATAKARGENPDDAARHRARYAMEQAGKATKGDGKDVGHVKALGKGGSNDTGNLQMQSKGSNRSFSRNPDGSMKSEKSKRESK